MALWGHTPSKSGVNFHLLFLAKTKAPKGFVAA
jgi:hypothetical protein